MSIKGWMSKMWCIYIMKYYSTMKRNGVLIPATVRMNPEKVMLNARPDTKGFMSHDSMCMKHPQQANLQRKETCGSKGQAGRGGECGVTA